MRKPEGIGTKLVLVGRIDRVDCCHDWYSHLISRLAECRNRMHITSTESSNGTKSTFTSTCNAVEAQISADITRDMHGTPIDNRTHSCSCYQAFHPQLATEVPQRPSRHSFDHDHLLRILQSHMCARNFWLISRPLPFQPPTGATPSVMTATIQPLQRTTATLMINHYSQSLLSPLVLILLM